MKIRSVFSRLFFCLQLLLFVSPSLPSLLSAESNTHCPTDLTNLLANCKHHRNPLLRFGLRGPRGPRGPRGETGATGLTNGWLLQGNEGTRPLVNFIGTIDNVDFTIAVGRNGIGTGVFTFFKTTGVIEPVNPRQNTVIGENSLPNVTTGTENTVFGGQAAQGISTGFQNIVVGYNAYNEGDASRNIAIGRGACRRNGGNDNVAIGNNSLSFGLSGDGNTGNSNIAIGSGSLSGGNSGSANIAIGPGALLFNQTGLGNTAVGESSLVNNIDGTFNTAIGNGAGVINADLTNATAIGFGALVQASNTIQLGNPFVTAVLTPSGNYATGSDKRFKVNIQEDVPGLDFITKLQPVTYHVDMNKMALLLKMSDDRRLSAEEEKQEKIVKSGFIAQDVEEAANQVGYDFDGIVKPAGENGLYSLSYASFVVPLVKAVQEQQALIDELKLELKEIKASLATHK